MLKERVKREQQVISEEDFLLNLSEFLVFYGEKLSVANINEILTDRLLTLEGK